MAEETERKPEEIELELLDPNGKYDPDNYFGAMQGLKELGTIVFDPDVEKGRKALGTYLGDPKMFSKSPVDELINVRDSVRGQMQVAVAKHTIGNLEEILEETDEAGLIGVIPGLPIEESDTGERAEAIRDYQEEAGQAHEKPEEYLKGKLGKLSPRIREIVLAYGSNGLMKSYLANAQSNVAKHFRDEEGGLDTSAVRDYIQEVVKGYIGKGDEKEQAPAYSVALAVAQVVYQGLEQKQAEEQAEKDQTTEGNEDEESQELRKAA